jgi:hypothetical protein
VQGVSLYILVAPLPPSYHIDEVYFQRVSQNKRRIGILAQVEAGVEIPFRGKIKIDNVDRYHFRQFFVVLPPANAFAVHPAPVKHTAPVNVVLVAELYLDVHHCTVRKDSHDIKYAGFSVFDIRDKRLVFEYLDGFDWFLSRMPHVADKDRIQETEQLQFIAFFTHNFVKKVIIERVESWRRLVIIVNFHTPNTARGCGFALVKREKNEKFCSSYHIVDFCQPAE